MPILLVEQNLEVVRRLADGAIVIGGGRVVHTGVAGEILDDDDLTALLGVLGRRHAEVSASMSMLVLYPDHRRRPRRAVLPRRLRPLPHLRAHARAELRARRVPHPGAFTGWAVAQALGDGIAGARSCCRSSVGALVGAVFATLTELVLIRPLYERHIEQVLVTVGLSFAAVALFEGIWGTDPINITGPPWLKQTTDVLGARIPNTCWVLMIAAAARARRARAVPARRPATA